MQSESVHTHQEILCLTRHPFDLREASLRVEMFEAFIVIQEAGVSEHASPVTSLPVTSTNARRCYDELNKQYTYISDQFMRASCVGW
jgi:hypothetical protein